MDNSPEAVKGRVRSMTKAIRYKARKEGNLMKAFNDFMGSQSGISATERSAVKKSLGLSENKYRTAKSDWRTELSEVVAGEENEKTIKEKKVKNKIVINPTIGMKEAIEELGGTIMEMSEIDEATYGGSKKKEEPKDKRMLVTNADKKGNTPAYQKFKAGDKNYKAADHMKEDMIEKSRELDIKQGRIPGRIDEGMGNRELMLQKKRAQIDIMIAKDRKKQVQKAKQAPTKVVGEGYDKPDEKLKTDRDGYRVPKKDADEARDRLLAKARAKRLAKMKEETEDSLKDKRMMRGGVDGNTRYDRPPAKPNLSGKKKSDPNAKKRAVDRVRDDIIKQYGKGALM